MFHRLAVGAALSCCVLVVASLSRAEDQTAPPKTVVQVEFWMVEVDFAKLRKLDLTSEHLGADGQSRTVKITDVLDGKEKDAPILQRPDELLKLLRHAAVARVLMEPTLATLNGRKATLQVGRSQSGSKLDVTPLVKNDGRIRLDIRAEHNEPIYYNRRTPPGNRQRSLDTSWELDSGKVFLFNPAAEGIALYSNGKPSVPSPVLVTLIRATVNAPGVDQPVAQASATASPAEPNANPPANLNVKAITIHLTVVQVNSDKLKKLGFTWSQLTPDGTKTFSIEDINDRPLAAEQLNGFLKSLQQNGLACVLAEPTLLTLDGRPASFGAGTTKLDLVPILLESGRVKLECRLKTGDSPELLTDAELDLGKMCVVRGMKITPRLGRQSQDTETLVLARVDLLKSGEITNIAGPPTYIEVADKSK